LAQARPLKLRYTLPALADLDAILTYIAVQSPEGAKRVHSRIRSIIDILSLHPFIGVKTDDPIVRRLVTTPYPYVVFYEVGGDEIIVHAVRHAARKPFGPGPE
jgi:toxin ParE1/3/4